MRRLPLLTAALGTLLAVAVVVLVVVVVSGGNGGKGSTAKKDDPFPENKAFHTNAAASPFAGAAPLTIRFNAKAFRASGSVRYFWRFDDGTTSKQQNPIHTFPKAGYYQILMDAVDARGHRDRFTLLCGTWPAGLWNTSLQRQLTPPEAQKAVHAQGRRTAKRRRTLQAEHRTNEDFQVPGEPTQPKQPQT
jgi:hypothetical protein